MTASKIGPVGYTGQATDFDIQPKDGSKAPRLHSVVVVTGWAINGLGLSYEEAGGAPTLIQPAGMEPAPVRSTFEIPRGDSLVAVKVGWGSQYPGYPSNEVITLQFETKNGLKSPVYGGTSGSAKVTEHVLRAPEGHEIIGLFGARGGPQNLIQRLGAHVRASCDCADLARRIAALEERSARQEKQIAELARMLKPA